MSQRLDLDITNLLLSRGRLWWFEHQRYTAFNSMSAQNAIQVITEIAEIMGEIGEEVLDNDLSVTCQKWSNDLTMAVNKLREELCDM